VVVDHGSTDHSAQKVEIQIALEPRLRLVHQQNLGVAASRNVGVANASAAYPTFVDANDLWAPRKIDLQMNSLLDSTDAVGLANIW
jgi:glycosyltransferase involved in cell wall biosynthesis